MGDLSPILQLIRDAGAIAVLVVILYYGFIADPPRLVPKSRLDDEKEALKEERVARKEATEGWKAQADTTKRLADAIERRNAIDEERAKMLERLLDERTPRS